MRLLCVDDEPNILSGIERTLFGDFDIVTAESGRQALEILQAEDEFDVVLSDMRMPEMDGAELLKQIRQSYPDTVRMLLTGYSEMEAAVRAINDGQIFRFLCKPCPEPELRSALAAAERQIQLIKGEKQLLEDTLRGAVQALTDTLSLAAPIAFQRAEYLQSIMEHMAASLHLDNAWQYSVAGMLAPIGCITLPSDLLTLAYTGQKLSESQTEMLEGHPRTGSQLLQSIPRLECVAAMIGQQNVSFRKESQDAPQLGATMLALSNAILTEMAAGRLFHEAVVEVEASRKYPRSLLDSLASYQPPQGGSERTVTVGELAPGMVALADVLAVSGAVLVAKGKALNVVAIQRLHNFAKGVGVQQPIRVSLPQSGPVPPTK